MPDGEVSPAIDNSIAQSYGCSGKWDGVEAPKDNTDKVIFDGRGGLSSYEFKREGDRVVFRAVSGDDGDGHVDSYYASFKLTDYREALERIQTQDMLVVDGLTMPPHENLTFRKEGNKVRLTFNCEHGTYCMSAMDIERLRA